MPGPRHGAVTSTSRSAYSSAAVRAHSCVLDATPHVKAVSIDECYADVTHLVHAASPSDEEGRAHRRGAPAFGHPRGDGRLPRVDRVRRVVSAGARRHATGQAGRAPPSKSGRREVGARETTG